MLYLLRRLATTVCFTAILMSAGTLRAADDELAGLKSIALPGLPGPVCAFGPDAKTLVTATSDGQPVSLIAAAHYGKGMMIALGHDGFLRDAKLMDALTAFSSAPKDMLRTMPGGDIHEGDIEPLRKFVEDGGVLIVGEPGWGWLQLHPGKTLAGDCPANQLFTEAGLLFTDGEIDVPANRTLEVKRDIPNDLNCSRAFDELSKPGAKASPLAVAELIRFLSSVPTDDQILLPRINNQPREHLSMPSAEHPITNEKGLTRVLLAQEFLVQRGKQHQPASPAALPISAEVEAACASSTILVETSIPDWHSTGCYAAPGAKIIVTTDDDSGLRFRIGPHSDHLWDQPEWKRAPEIDNEWPLKSGEAYSSAFGGLIYIVVAESAPKKTIHVTIANVAPAAYFALGKTDPGKWRETVRDAIAPWAELEGRNVIITVPSEFIRHLDDPESLMKFWDRVADADADLAGMPHERKRPERYVTDVQISAGYMHSGYPIMTHLDAAPRFVDLKTLERDGDWGMFHEMGHNHQSEDWTFDGTGEVTVNLFTMYCLDTLCTNHGKMHDAMSADNRAKRTAKYLKNGAKFDDWKADPFLALIMYKQFQEAFGWDAYKKVFAEYRALPDSQRPKSDDEKRDQWMVRFSHTVGRNLGPFFEYWGVPTSQSARDSIKDLPTWMPEPK